MVAPITAPYGIMLKDAVPKGYVQLGVLLGETEKTVRFRFQGIDYSFPKKAVMRVAGKWEFWVQYWAVVNARKRRAWRNA